jgi:cytoskeletal protein RodZ
MRLSALGWGIVVAVLGASAVPSAQLGEVARKEEERRKAVKSSGKVYTNDSLRPAPPPSAPATPTTPGDQPASPSAAAPGTGTTGGATGQDSKKDEASWRDRVKNTREALDRAKVFAEALQSRINALNTDFVNRDDPVQRNGIATELKKATAEMDRVKKEIDTHTKALNEIQEEARRAGVPAAWVR